MTEHSDNAIIDILPTSLIEVKRNCNEVIEKHGDYSQFFLEYSSGPGLDYSATLSVNQKWLAIPHEGKVGLWDIERKCFVRHLRSAGKSIAFLQSDTQLLVRTGRRLELLDIKTGVFISRSAPLASSIEDQCTISNGSERVVVMTQDGMVSCLDVPSLKTIWQLPFPEEIPSRSSNEVRKIGLEYIQDENLLLCWLRERWVGNAGFFIVEPKKGALQHYENIPLLEYCGWLGDGRVFFQTYSRWGPRSGEPGHQGTQKIVPQPEPIQLLNENVKHKIWTHFPKTGIYITSFPLKEARSLYDNRVLINLEPFKNKLHRTLLDWEPLKSAIMTNDAAMLETQLDVFDVVRSKDNCILWMSGGGSFRCVRASAEKILTILVSHRTYEKSPFSIECYDLGTGERIWEHPLEVLDSPQKEIITLSPNGRYLALKWRHIDLYDFTQGQWVSLDMELERSDEVWNFVSCGFDAQSTHFICSNGLTTNIFSLDTFEKVAKVPYGQIPQHECPILLSREKLLVCIHDNDMPMFWKGASLAVWDINAEKLVGLSMFDARVQHYGFSFCGQWILHIEDENTLVLHNGQTLELVRKTLIDCTTVDYMFIRPDGQEVWLIGHSLKDKAKTTYTFVITIPNLEVRMNSQEEKEEAIGEGYGFIGGGKRFVSYKEDKGLEFIDTNTGTKCASFYRKESGSTWFLHDGSENFYTENTSCIGVLQKDPKNPNDPGEIVSQEERETFIKQHNKRELVMAGVLGSSAYEQYFLTKQQLEQDDMLELGTLNTKLLKYKK